MIVEYIGLFFKEAVVLFLEMAPYITLGMLIAGGLYVILSKDFVARHIGGNTVSAVFKAALFGVPLPLCSCGVVPTAVYLKNSGASKSAALAFLISTPQTGVDSIAATWGMLGPVFAGFRAVTALLTGMAGGIYNMLLDRGEKNGINQKQERPVSIKSTPLLHDDKKYAGVWGKIRKMFHFSFFELLDDIAVNFLIGLALAAVISIAIPEDFFAGTFFSKPLISMLLMVAIGIPMYVCSTSSIPIALALIAKGFSPGAAYVFLVAGPATNAASLAIISKAFGFKATVRYLLTIIAGSIGFGLLMDFVYNSLGIPPFGGAEHHFHGEQTTGLFTLLVSVFFLVMLLLVLYLKFKRTRAARKAGKTLKTAKEKNMTRIAIEGMSCGHCTASVEKALSMVSGIKKIDVSLEGKCAVIDGNFRVEEAEQAIRNAGYTVTGTKKE